MKNKTEIVFPKPIVFRPKESDQIVKTVACEYAKSHGLLDIDPDMDVVIASTCLVSAGNRIGINRRDDIFLAEEVWKARKTPLLKPLNWMHHEKEIIGSTYRVYAKDMDGNPICIDHDMCPVSDFDLYTDSVVYKFIHPERVQEIENKFPNNIFVSMEAYFDYYDYGIFDSTGLVEILRESEYTKVTLDYRLKANGGTGILENGKFVGRVLRNITFGGQGIVYNPANLRSMIVDLRNYAKESTPMIGIASATQDKTDEVKMEKVEITEPTQAVSELEKLITMLKTKWGDNASKVEASSDKFAFACSLIDGILLEKEEALTVATKSLEEAKAEAGKLKASDSSKLLEEAMAEIASLKEKIVASDAVALNYRNTLRGNEIIALLSNKFDEVKIKEFISKASNMSDDLYKDWLDEKKLFVTILNSKASIEPEQTLQLSTISTGNDSSSRVVKLSQLVAEKCGINLNGEKK